TWSTCQHPVSDDCNGSYDGDLNKAGYARATQFHPGGDERAVTITVWGDNMDPSRPGQKAAAGSPKYLLDIEFHPAGMGETVAAAGIVDLMNLLATWTPMVQTAMICDDAAEQWKKDNL
ncbi:hypothetical protein, partial [Micromonospora tarensis]